MGLTISKGAFKPLFLLNKTYANRISQIKKKRADDQRVSFLQELPVERYGYNSRFFRTRQSLIHV